MKRTQVSRAWYIRSSLAACGAFSLAASPWDVAAQAPFASLLIRERNLFPESLAYLVATRRFYVGSLRFGRISSIDSSGNIATLCDDAGLVSTFGIFADESRGVVHVCNADPGVGVRSNAKEVGSLCQLVTIEARTGDVLRRVDLKNGAHGKHLPNDGAVARDGSIYVTDTLSPVVYRVSQAGRAERFASDAGFAPGPGPGLDGIAIASSGTIVVNHISNGTFFRIEPSSGVVKKIGIAGGAVFPGIDGMRFERNGRLIVTQSTLGGPKARNALNAFTSSDDWRTATVSSVIPLSRSTYQSVRTGDGVFGVQSRLETLFKAPNAANVEAFRIVRISG